MSLFLKAFQIADSRQIKDGLTTLNRIASQRMDSPICDELKNILNSNPITFCEPAFEVALQNQGPLPNLIMQVIRENQEFDLARKLSDKRPDKSINTRKLYVELLEFVVSNRRYHELDPNERALDYANLAKGKSELGNDNVAFEDILIAESLMNAECPKEDSSFILGAKAALQAQLGHHIDALKSIQRALKLGPSPEDLLEILNNYGSILCDTGHAKKAKKVWKNALKVNQKNSSLDELTRKSVLANILVNLSNLYSSQENHTKALEYATTSLREYQELSQHNADAFDSEIIAGLFSVSVAQSNAGDHRSALETTKEVLKLVNYYLKICPESFFVNLISTLEGLAIEELCEVDPHIAIKTIQEGIDQMERYHNQESLKPILAKAYDTRAFIQSCQGMHKKALKSSLKSLELFKEITAIVPDSAIQEYSLALLHTGDTLRILGRFKKSIAYCKKALATYQRFQESNAMLNCSEIVEYLNANSNCLLEDQQFNEALRIADEALSLLELSPKKVKGYKYTQLIADTLHCKSNALISLGFSQEALECAKQQIELLESKTENTFFHSESLGNAYHSISTSLFKLENFNEAKVYAKKEVKIYQDLCIKDTYAFEIDLVSALSHLAMCQRSLKQIDDALKCINEVMKILKKRGNSSDGHLYEHLSHAHSIKASLLYDLGEFELALKHGYSYLRYCEECIECTDEPDSERANAYQMISVFHFELNDIKMAKKYAKKSICEYEKIVDNEDGRSFKEKLAQAKDTLREIRRKAIDK